jgi:hypothetical protein
MEDNESYGEDDDLDIVESAIEEHQEEKIAAYEEALKEKAFESASITSITKRIDENPDSIELGTPSKGGALKVYFDASFPKDAESKIINALQLRKFMRDQESIIEAVTQEVKKNDK